MIAAVDWWCVGGAVVGGMIGNLATNAGRDRYPYMTAVVGALCGVLVLAVALGAGLYGVAMLLGLVP